jgi:predicted Rossmann fold nucleotide-binding protein DprA/Smf involved in DNA uptake
LRGGGLAIVGSRDVDASGETFARDVAEQCAREGISVVSGGARGVDQVAMAGALDAGGTVLGVLADTLLRRSVSRDARDALASKRLVLVSPYNPEAGFNVGNAMGRNKLIYALADYGLVISSDYKKGGTWEGAQEELKRESGRPVFVRVGEGVPKGNLELTKMGARPFPEEYRTSGLSHFLEEASRKIPESVPVQPKGFVQPGLFSEPPTVEAPANQPFVAKESSSVQSSTAYVAMTILQAIKPVLVAALDKPRGLEELAKLLHVRKVQLQDWVKAFIADGTLEEQIKRKAKKLALRAPPASDRNQ